MHDTEKPKFRIGDDGEIEGLPIAEDTTKKKKGIPSLWYRVSRNHVFTALSRIVIMSLSVYGLITGAAAAKSAYDQYWDSRCPKGDLSIDARAGKITFLSRHNVQSEVDVIDENGSSWRGLTDDTFDDYYPALSPDGKRVAFVSVRDGTWDIYMANTVTSDTRRLTSGALTKGSPMWSPDGKYLALIMQPQGQTEHFLYVITTDGTQAHRLTEDVSPESLVAWSPDGKQIAFTSASDPRWSNTAPISVINVDGSNKHFLKETEGSSKFSLTWLRDGSGIVFSTTNNLYAVNPASSNRPRLLTGSLDSALVPQRVAQSPNGKLIAVSVVFNNHYHIWVMSNDGTNLRQVTHRQLGYLGAFAWLSDSQRIAYITNNENGNKIWITNVNTGYERQLCVLWFS